MGDLLRQTRDLLPCSLTTHSMNNRFAFLAVTSFACAFLARAGQSPPGTVLWNYDAGALISSSPSLAEDGTIYIAAGAALCAVTNSGAFGSNRWTLPTQVARSPSVGADGTIYFGAADAMCSVYGVHPDASLAWTIPLQPEFGYQIRQESTPAIGVDGTLYAVAGGRLYAVSSAGSKKWEYILGPESGPYPLSPVIGGDGTVYVASTSTMLYAINPDGTKKWSSTALTSGPGESPCISSDGSIYYAAGLLYAFSPLGTNVWSTDYNYYRWFAGVPVVGANGTVYLAATITTPLWAVSSPGQPAWSALGSNPANVTTPAIDAGGTIYYCISNSIWAVDPRGQVRWRFTSPDQPSPQFPDLAVTSPILGSDGTIYVALGSKVFALASGTNGPANSPWPMYQQNAQHTGRVQKPALNQPKQRADANFEFQLYPQQLGLTYTIQSSTNLNDWSSLTSVVATTLPMDVVDLSASNFPARFYRASSPP